MNTLIATVLVLGLVAALLLLWRRRHPASWWRVAVWPVKYWDVRTSWRALALACGLAGKPRRTLVRKAMRRDQNPVLPRLVRLRGTSDGWRAVVRLWHGQTPEDYLKACDALAHAWRVPTVRTRVVRPGRVEVVALRRDPLTHVRAVPAIEPETWDADRLLRVDVGSREDGSPWVFDLRQIPHWLVAGATQSGKSTLVNALITALAARPVALVAVDCKGGMELSPYEPRLTALVEDRAQAIGLLGDLIDIMRARMTACRAAGVRDIWALPEDVRPVPVVIFVDEVAELYLTASKDERKDVAAVATSLLRIAQLGRALGFYLIVAGQRFGADLGDGVTALRAQLSGRCCHRVNDPETAVMVLGDVDRDAVGLAQDIPATLPGVAVIADDTSGWVRARSRPVTPETAEQAARDHADLRVDLADLTGERLRLADDGPAAA